MQEQQPAIFTLDKIYIRDISLELPNAPKIFLNRDQPAIDLNLNFNSEELDKGVYQTVLHAIVNAKIGSESMFLIEIYQAGIFQIKNVLSEQMEYLQNVECPNILFPYLRETVSDLTTRAGFVPVILAPVNFAYLHQQKQQTQLDSVSNTIN